MKLTTTGLLLLLSVNLFAKTETVTIYSKAMHKPIKATVVTPSGYESKEVKSYPTVYILHGWSENYSSWTTKVKPNLQKLVDLYNIIAVCPDGARSWYFDSPIDTNIQYETYIAKEVVAYIDDTYRTIKKRSARAITGLSMGGQGAFNIAINHPKVFGAVASTAGGVALDSVYTQFNIPDVFGPYHTNQALWHKNAIVKQIEKVKNKTLAIYFDCGYADELFTTDNERLHQRMNELGIEHTYETFYGKHNPSYFGFAIENHLAFFHKFFKNKGQVLTGYLEPDGTLQQTGGVFLKSITSNGADKEISYHSTQRPRNIFNLLENSLATTPGSKVELHLTGDSLSNSCHIYVYLDRNGNKSFSDPGELLLQEAATLSNASSREISIPISIPSDATIGDSRLRIRITNGIKTPLERHVDPNYAVNEGIIYDIPFKVTSHPTNKTISVPSAIMHKNISSQVILPESYFTNSEKRYPVIYLLHGYTDSYATWSERKRDIEAQASAHDVIIVCPDGALSWYLDSPIDSTIRYESYITKELIPFVDSHYRTIDNRSGRAITGNSMGGHGACLLALRHKEIFGAFGATAGGVDLRPFPNGWNLQSLLGSQAEHMEEWKSHSAIELASNLKEGEYAIYIDCGEQEELFLKENQRLHQKLTQMGVSHTYRTSPGGHNWVYWTREIDHQIAFFDKVFRAGIK